MSFLKSGDKVLYFKDTCELVTIVKVHQDDPEEPYFTIKLSNGDEKQTVKKYLGTYSFFPFKKINLFDEEFWDFKQLTIKGKLYAYSRTTRLILELHVKDIGAEYSDRAFKLFGIRGEGDKIIRGKKIPFEILKFCLKNKIQVFKNKPLFWL
jgi:small nuclear ribonucleoprotein (snRNP)-like protein